MRNPLLWKVPTLELRWSYLMSALLFLLVLEMALMGSGRMLEFGPLTARMLLWAVALCCSVVILTFRRTIGLSTWILLGCFAAILCFSAALGFLNGAGAGAVGEDVKPLAYVFLLPFFEIAINSESRLKLLVCTIQFAAVVMALGYLIILCAVLSGRLSFSDLYAFSNTLAEQDMTFRGESGMFFYRGFLYLCAGAIFFAFGKSKWSKFIALLLFAGVIASGTRGFILSMGIVFVLYLTVWTKHHIKGSILAVLLAVAWFAVAPKYLSTADREESNQIRINTLREVADNTTPASVIFGHGLGHGVPERPVHMEIAYVEVFYKQGLIGLSWWAAVFAMLISRFAKAHSGSEAAPLFLCGLFVFIESFTNPYITNPLGISLLFASIAGLQFLGLMPHSLSRERQCIQYS